MASESCIFLCCKGTIFSPHRSKGSFFGIYMQYWKINYFPGQRAVIYLTPNTNTNNSKAFSHLTVILKPICQPGKLGMEQTTQVTQCFRNMIDFHRHREGHPRLYEILTKDILVTIRTGPIAPSPSLHAQETFEKNHTFFPLQ